MRLQVTHAKSSSSRLIVTITLMPIYPYAASLRDSRLWIARESRTGREERPRAGAGMFFSVRKNTKVLKKDAVRVSLQENSSSGSSSIR